MNDTIDTTEKSIADLDERDVRALTQYLTVEPAAPGLYTVTSQSGSEYTVDLRDGHCTCADHRHRDVLCKHLRRVGFETGARPLPAWIDTDDLPADFGAHVEAEPTIAATDGGVEAAAVTIDADPETDDDATPRAECWCADYDLPCFAHYEGRP